jgi:hypothetical protein
MQTLLALFALILSLSICFGCVYAGWTVAWRLAREQWEPTYQATRQAQSFARQWEESSNKFRDLYFRELEFNRRNGIAPAVVAFGATAGPASDPLEKIKDPPTVGAADRRAMETRRKEETIRKAPRTDGGMEPIPLMDKSATPPPRLNDRE